MLEGGPLSGRYEMFLHPGGSRGHGVTVAQAWRKQGGRGSVSGSGGQTWRTGASTDVAGRDPVLLQG